MKEECNQNENLLKAIEEMKKSILDDIGFQLASIFWRLKPEQAKRYLELIKE